MRARFAAFVLLLLAAAATAIADGRIEGTITDGNGRPVGGVTVVVNEIGLAVVTDNDGSYDLSGIPAGTYSIGFSLGDDSVAENAVLVTDGQVTTLDKEVDWSLNVAETITVVSASRRVERIVDAPAAITVISQEQIEREAAFGQVPKLVEFTPGVDVTQSGIFDYNLNARGFNSSLNRRIVVLVDGRDPAVPFLASQEWPLVSQYMNDLDSVEFIRGPSSALYGPNAYNGVMNMVTRSPKGSEGGSISLIGGQLSNAELGDFSNFQADLRWATDLGGDWYLKLTGSYFQGKDYSVNRNVTVEYPGLALEAIPRTTVDNDVAFGNLRLDKYFESGDALTFEGGHSSSSNPVVMTGIGRFSIDDVSRDWLRVNYTAMHWNVLSYYEDRESEQTNLQTAPAGRPATLLSDVFDLEAQTNWGFNRDKIRLVGGLRFGNEGIDTVNSAGRQTLVLEPVDVDEAAAYAQADFELTENLKLVVAARYDDSDLYDGQFSPKGGLVWGVADNQTLRFTYNEAFQVPNYSEYFLFATVGLFPGGLIDQAVCGPFGVDCGLDPVIPVIASGNVSLELEEITSWEVGYSGVLGRKVFMTVDYYHNELTNFITDLLPQLGTPLGQINPNYPFYAASGVPPALLAALNTTVASLTGGGQLSFDPNGDQVVTAVSYANFGLVNTQGVDFGLTAYITPRWQFNATYAWFDFDIKEQIAGDPLLPNAPENKFSLGLAYNGSSFNAALNYRWVDDFAWAVGTLFRGEVESYNVVDLNTNWDLSEQWIVGLNVANLFDEVHYEAFGGDLVGRRALVSLGFRW